VRPTMEASKFSFSNQLRVRNYEVDWQGIVHNGSYLLYFEVGRVEYLKNIGAQIDLNMINGASKVVLVRNEINYKAPALFDQLLTVRTRIAFIKNTSFAMEGLMERADTGEAVAENVAYHVWLDPKTDKPVPVPEDFRSRVVKFEGRNCEFIASPDRH